MYSTVQVGLQQNPTQIMPQSSPGQGKMFQHLKYILWFIKSVYLKSFIFWLFKVNFAYLMG